MMRLDAIEGLKVLKKGILIFGGIFGEGSGLLTDAPNDFILHIGDVHHVVDGVAAKFQIAAHQIREHKRPEVSNVSKVMHCGAAAVHAHGAPG